MNINEVTKKAKLDTAKLAIMTAAKGGLHKVRYVLAKDPPRGRFSVEFEDTIVISNDMRDDLQAMFPDCKLEYDDEFVMWD